MRIVASDSSSYVQDNPWLMFTSWGVAFACIIVLACCGDVRRKSPGNFICLAVFTGQFSPDQI